MKMSTHEDDDHEDQDQEINVDSDSRLSCGSGSDIDMDENGSCYDSETALGWELIFYDFFFICTINFMNRWCMNQILISIESHFKAYLITRGNPYYQ